jgi:predicted ATP-dependent endonuclease of OLD family
VKPLAFRIRDFRSIKDSGIFSASGDNITVLAGQNEAGKTAVLLAIRDFDLPPGRLPETPEFRPEGDLEAEPRVSVQFRLEEDDLEALRKEIEFPEFFDRFGTLDTFWIERHLLTGTFTLDPSKVLS